MAVARFPFVLREQLGDEGYAALVAMVEERRDEMLTSITERFERRLTEESSRLRVEIEGLRAEIAQHHAELMKWSLVGWVSQTATIAGIVVLMR